MRMSMPRIMLRRRAPARRWCLQCGKGPAERQALRLHPSSPLGLQVAPEPTSAERCDAGSCVDSTLDQLQGFSDGDLEKTAHVLVAGQCLVILRIDEGDGDDAPLLDAGDWSETARTGAG
jgi:hypothetical protein